MVRAIWRLGSGLGALPRLPPAFPFSLWPHEVWILISSISQLAKPRHSEVTWLARGHPAAGGLSGIQTQVCLAPQTCLQPQNGPTLAAPPAEAGGGSAHLANVSQAETSDGCPLFSPLEV